MGKKCVAYDLRNILQTDFRLGDDFIVFFLSFLLNCPLLILGFQIDKNTCFRRQPKKISAKSSYSISLGDVFENVLLQIIR